MDLEVCSHLEVNLEISIIVKAGELFSLEGSLKFKPLKWQETTHRLQHFSPESSFSTNKMYELTIIHTIVLI